MFGSFTEPFNYSRLGRVARTNFRIAGAWLYSYSHRMPFLLHSKQCQSTEGMKQKLTTPENDWLIVYFLQTAILLLRIDDIVSGLKKKKEGAGGAPSTAKAEEDQGPSEAND